jgi:hypothetical protein
MSWTGLGVGIASLLGFGEDVNPIQKKRKELADIQSKLRATIDQNNIAALSATTQNLKNLFTYIGTTEASIRNFIEYNDELLWESIAQENLFILILTIVIIILVIYNLIR